MLGCREVEHGGKVDGLDSDMVAESVSHFANGAEVSYLYALLEGQVSVLGPGMVVADDTVKLLEADRNLPKLASFKARTKVPTDQPELPGVKYLFTHHLVHRC